MSNLGISMSFLGMLSVYRLTLPMPEGRGFLNVNNRALAGKSLTCLV